MLPAIPNPFVLGWFHWYCRHSLGKHFHRVMLYGDVSFDPRRSTLYVVNHCAFWDALVMNHLIHTRRRQPAYCMADAVQVEKHPFFRRVGAFSVDRTSRRDGGRAVRYAMDRLAEKPSAVVIFPQGQIEPADVRPIRFESGVGSLVERLPGVDIVLVALRYEFWLDQRPELLIDLSRPIDRTVDGMQWQMMDRLRLLKSAGRERRAGDVILQGRRSISEWSVRK